MVVISITLPYELLEKLDRVIEARGYFSRSEAIRDAIRNLVDEASIDTGEEVSAIIMVTYNREQGSIDKRLSDLRHEYNDIVVEGIHRHFGSGYCIDILMAEGNISQIRTLIGRIRGLKNIYQVKALILPKT